MRAGPCGSAYLERALVTAIGLGGNRPQDAVYPPSETDADGKPHTGANQYVPKGQLPLVEGFWSLKMHNADYFFVDNSLNRSTLSCRDNLKLNADGANAPSAESGLN